CQLLAEAIVQFPCKSSSFFLLSLHQLTCQKSKSFASPLAFYCDAGNDLFKTLSQQVWLSLVLPLACQERRFCIRFPVTLQPCSLITIRLRQCFDHAVPRDFRF